MKYWLKWEGRRRVIAINIERMKWYLLILYNKNATVLFLIESRLFTKQCIDYQTVAAIFTEDLVCTFFQVYVQMDFLEATAETLATEGIEH